MLEMKSPLALLPRLLVDCLAGLAAERRRASQEISVLSRLPTWDPHTPGIPGISFCGCSFFLLRLFSFPVFFLLCSLSRSFESKQK